eukprot:Skav217195  [mRNA]  locus=scaffold557:176217:181265:- [translate_table: standard]
MIHGRRSASACCPAPRAPRLRFVRPKPGTSPSSSWRGIARASPSWATPMAAAWAGRLNPARWSTARVLDDSAFVQDPHGAARRAWDALGRCMAPNGALMRAAATGLRGGDVDALLSDALTAAERHLPAESALGPESYPRVGLVAEEKCQRPCGRAACAPWKIRPPKKRAMPVVIPDPQRELVPRP